MPAVRRPIAECEEDMAKRLFYSYSSRDEVFRQQLDTHLAGLRRQGIIEPWSFRKIPAGSEWKSEIDENLEAAHIVLLLVSADFLASDYCYEIEMKRALEKHERKEAVVIPVILRDCDWEHTEFAKLQAVPTNVKPVNRHSPRDTAWKDVVVKIRDVASKDVLASKIKKAIPQPALEIEEKVHTEPKFEGPARLDFSRWSVVFPITLGSDRKLGIISGEALEDYFGAGDTKEGLVDAFEANRAAILKVARERVMAGALDSAQELILTTANFSDQRSA